MDQAVPPAPVETIEEIFDEVVRTDGIRSVERPGKAPVIVMSMSAYRRVSPLGAALEEIWRKSKEAGLDRMTMEEIDEEVSAMRREKRAADAASR